jgi:hypothetical protein
VSYLRYLFLIACPTNVALCFSCVCLRLVYPMLPVSMDRSDISKNLEISPGK